MRNVIIALVLLVMAGCAAGNRELSQNEKTEKLLCEIDVCESFAHQHDYTLLEASAHGRECRCHLQSAHMPDAFDVNLAHQAR